MIIRIILEIIIFTLLTLWTISTIYSYLFLFVAILPLKREKNHRKEIKKKIINHFAILIPAHNEREVIGYLLESLSNLDYPKEAYKIFVIADNCTDDTATIAEEKGAIVLKRIDNEKRGKPYAIGWALEQLRTMEYQYDAIVIFDADNLVSSNFLILANAKLNEGAEAFQGSVECKNIEDSWVSIGNYITYSALNRIYQNGRERLGIGALFCGTGMGFTRRLLERIGWYQSSLTEDREFTYRLLLNSVKVAWIDEAKVYDEKPIGAKQSVQQQSRWIWGWMMDLKHFFPSLWKAWRRTHNMAFLDAMYNLISPLFFGKGLILIPLLLLLGNLYTWIWWGLLFFLMLLYHGIGLKLNNAERRYYGYLLVWPFYRLLSIFAFILALVKKIVTKDKMSWIHTKHTRGIKLDEVQK